MKQIISILTLAILLLANNTQAQLDINIGAKVGANFNKIDGKYWDNGYKANFLAGAFVGVKVLKIGGQIEALYTQATYTTGKDFYSLYGSFYRNAADSLKEGSFKVNYLNIPVLLNLHLFPRATIHLGPQFTTTIGSIKDKDGLVTDAADLFKSGSFDGVIGVTLNLPAKLSIGARYIIGLSNINNQHNKTNAVKKIDDTWKQKTLQVHIGYTIF